MSNYRKIVFVIILPLLVLIINLSLVLFLYVGRQATLDTKEKSEAILVLGARSYLKGKYNPCLLSRVEHAVALSQKKYAPLLIMSGGYDKEDNVSEAETMKKIALEKGIMEEQIILEKDSTSTYENMLNSQKIMKEKDIRSVLIITEPFHAARVGLVAEKLGLDYTISPAIESPCWRWKYFSKYFLKEPFAIIAYKLQGKL